MFRNADGKRLPGCHDLRRLRHLQKGHGIAFADLNNDGEQDIFSLVGGAAEADTAHSQLFANPGHGNNWLKLKLEGVKTNRAAIGARIKVVLDTGTGERAIYRTVGSGGSFGANPMRQEIGMGQATDVVRVEIFWPASGKTQVIRDLKLDRCYAIREGSDATQEIVLKSFAWPAPSSAHVHHHDSAPGR